jgi:hydroxycarboxylate dehydrogenase B
MSAPLSPHLIALPRLQQAMRRVVRGFGSTEAEVAAVVDNLVEANLTGHDSHGIGMLPRYAEAFVEGGLKPNTHVKTVLDAGALLRLDGGAGFGQVIGAEAMALGIERARTHGTAVVALGNAHHLGRIGAWAEQAAAGGLVSMHFVNVVARAIVAPHGGRDARFGTNPFCVGIPIAGRAPVILDFATSMIAQGKTRVAHNQGKPVPEGCLLDDQGRPSTDPRWTVVPPLGALLTFGGHKGYGLALVCELLGGALAAGMTQGDDPSGRRRVLNGMLSVLIDPGALADRAAFEAEAQTFLAWAQASPPRDGFPPVMVAGDPERATKAERSAHGVPVDRTTWQEILDAAVKLGVDPAAVNADAGLA